MDRAVCIKSLILLFLLILIVPAANAQLGFGNTNAVHALQVFQKRADRFYDDGRYNQALRLYKRLSQYSDKFSQYRLASMYLDGFGVEKNLLEAYAWSYVSAESRKPKYVAFHKEIRSMLDEEQLALAREKAGEYIAEYGLFSNAVNARRLIASEKKRCTGSRVGATCSNLGVSSIACNLRNSSIPSRRCLGFGSIGITGIGILPAELRKVERALDTFIQEYNPGRVELGDLELIDG